MTRMDTFAFRVNDQERRLIERLAKQLKRSQSDAVRFVIREAAAALGVEPELAQPDVAKG